MARRRAFRFRRAACTAVLGICAAAALPANALRKSPARFGGPTPLPGGPDGPLATRGAHGIGGTGIVPVLLPLQAEEMASLQSPLSSAKPPNTDNPHFRISFRCDNSISEERCTRAEAAFVRAADRISSVLALAVPVDVSASFESFCGRPNAKADARCSATNSVLGSASPTAFYEFAADEADEFGTDTGYLYPSSLAKQFLGTDRLSPEGVDIMARFNGDFGWWIDGETDGDLADAEYDLEEAITHELLHGMGFISSWFAWLGAAEAMLTPSYVVRNSTGHYTGFAKEYLYNKWVADNVNGVWMSSWARTIRLVVAASVPPTTEWSSWIRDLKASPAYNVTRHLFQVSQSDRGLLLWYTDGETNTARSAVLYTPATYSPGSSVSHLDMQYYEAAGDWLMRPYAISGASLDDIRPRSAQGSGTIGDVTVNILRAMGYRTVAEVQQGEQGSAQSFARRQVDRPRGAFWLPPQP
ncbi:hypothetical protein DFJ74DRAFT_667149 [Hyaloraphidium curvatum]|nr:hypothetical protein DFJ74DRAFT_667149 [Hyaloraphidium curvatum]